MESKTYKKSVGTHIVCVIRNFATVMFILSVFFIIVMGDFMPAIGMLQLVIAGTVAYEVFSSPTVIVRADGVVYKRGKTTRTLGYGVYHFRSDGKAGLIVQDRRSSRTETLKCSGFDKKLFLTAVSDIERRQTEFFFKRTASGEFSPAQEVQDTKIHDAPKVDIPHIKVDIPHIKVDIPHIKVDDIPADYNKLPEIGKLDGVSKHEEKKAPEHQKNESAPELLKIEFRYPRRAIAERAEYMNTLTVLGTLTAGVAGFLVWYLTLGASKSGMTVLCTALGIMAVCAVVCTATVMRRAAETCGLFSKLEITDRHLIIDNKRFKYDALSDKSMTPPTHTSGERYLSFTYDKKRYIYSLGKCAKPTDKRELRYFPRYTELAKLLRERGFAFK